MQYIIFDLEWNQPYHNDVEFLRQAQMPISGEIIQIGAVKVSSQMEVIDTFSLFIKPSILRTMHRHVAELTGITDEVLEGAPSFKEGLDLFISWCGPQPKLLSWGPDDLLLLIDNMRLHKLFSYWSFSYYDAQALYTYNISGAIKQLALKKALQNEDITMKRKAHNALNDALYTSSVLGQIDYFEEALRVYKEQVGHESIPVIYPMSLSFAIEDGFKNKASILEDSHFNEAFCPVCAKPLDITRMEHTTGSKYLSIGTCPEHGRFSILWKIQKYESKAHTGKKYFYVLQNITRTNKKIMVHYKNKAKINRLKREKYIAKLEEKARAQEQEQQGKGLQERY